MVSVEREAGVGAADRWGTRVRGEGGGGTAGGAMGADLVVIDTAGCADAGVA
jgi:hypothetical protein